MVEQREPELPRGIALAWGVAAAPQRGPKREMSVERIVDAAVEIADAEGLSAVSMAAVAAKLGYTPMSLYRYVTAKDDLVLLMQEQATGLPSEETREGTWREQLESLYAEQVHSYLAHPWALEVPISGVPVTPNSAAWMDAGLHALAETPLTHDERISVMLLVTGLARWTGIVFAGYDRGARESGLSTEEITVRDDALFRELITADAFPSLRDAIDAGVFLDETDPFAFGLARALDGVATYIAELEAGGEHEMPREADDAPVAGLDEDKRVREARKSLREAEKELRAARKAERQAVREATERLARRSS